MSFFAAFLPINSVSHLNIYVHTDDIYNPYPFPESLHFLLNHLYF